MNEYKRQRQQFHAYQDKQNPFQQKKDPPGWPPISMIERELIFNIAQGSSEVISWIYQLRILWVKAKQLPYLESLKWLQSHHVTGNRFLEFMEVECDRSPTRAMAALRQKVYSDFKTRNVIAKGY